MRVLVVGCGSIGRRHARNARALGVELSVCDVNLELAGLVSDELGGVPYFDNHAEAAGMANADAAIIATPSSTHVPIAMDLAQSGLNLFIEKPLSDSLKGTQELSEVVERKNLVVMMGQSFRFHEGFERVKGLLDAGEIGRVYHANLHGGWYLPDWHVHEDYRKEYAARAELGGGVILTNFSHSIDTIHWLFGPVAEVIGWKAKVGDLNIDVEDAAFCLIRTESGVVVMNSSDFLCRLPRSELTIIGSEGFIKADFTKKTIRIWRAAEKRFMSVPEEISEGKNWIKILQDGVCYDSDPDVVEYSFDGNRRYRKELEYFFDQCRSGVTDFDLDLKAGIRALRILSSSAFKALDGDRT